MSDLSGIRTGGTQSGGSLLSPADARSVAQTDLAFAQGGVDWDGWIATARSSPDDNLRRQFDSLVALAGGRSDNAAIKQVMERYGALLNAALPTATASEQGAALRGMVEQLNTVVARANPVGLLAEPLQRAVGSLLSSAGIAGTEWGSPLQSVLRIPGTLPSFQQGIAGGILEGARSLVVGVVDLAGRALQFGADGSILGHGGDLLRGITGRMPNWLEAAIPSHARGLASADGIAAAVRGIGNYLASHSAGQIAGDIAGIIVDQWENLKDVHAAAAAQGPEAEARWWGQLVGRIGFEVAATFFPVAGIAGKVSGGARTLDGVADISRGIDATADTLRTADRTADGLRIGETALDRGRAILADLPLTSRSLDDLYEAGKLSMDEARALAENVNWRDINGSWIYPPNSGFDTAPVRQSFSRGDYILVDRYGEPRGRFVSPLGEPYNARALPPGTDRAERLYAYCVTGDVQALTGRATPWFGEPGGAIQYQLTTSVENLLSLGKLEPIRAQ